MDIIWYLSRKVRKVNTLKCSQWSPLQGNLIFVVFFTTAFPIFYNLHGFRVWGRGVNHETGLLPPEIMKPPF